MKIGDKVLVNNPNRYTNMEYYNNHLKDVEFKVIKIQKGYDIITSGYGLQYKRESNAIHISNGINTYSFDQRELRVIH